MYIIWEESRGSIFFNLSNHITSPYSYRASLPALHTCGKIFKYFFFPDHASLKRDLSSLTRDGTQAPCIGSTES